MLYEMRKNFWENSTTGGKVTVQEIATGEIRLISGEELNPPVQAVLTTGESGHSHKLAVSPIDAAIAIAAGEDAFIIRKFMIKDFRLGPRHGASPLTAEEMRMLADRLPNQKSVDATDVENRLKMLSLDLVDVDAGLLWGKCTTETPNEARTRWQNHNTDDNSYHSAIPGNPAHAAGVTAYDLSLGSPLPAAETDNWYMEYLRAVADWRTDWEIIKKTKEGFETKVMQYFTKETTPNAKKIITDNFTYYISGLMPSDLADNRPKLIVSQTVVDRLAGKSLD